FANVPDRFDCQTIPFVMSPSSGSIAVAWKLTGPADTLVPFAGLRIVTFGPAFVLTALTTSVIDALPEAPVVSVAMALIVCVPAASVGLIAAPRPISPAML